LQTENLVQMEFVLEGQWELWATEDLAGLPVPADSCRATYLAISFKLNVLHWQELLFA
jgi:hypothetical protein